MEGNADGPLMHRLERIVYESGASSAVAANCWVAEEAMLQLPFVLRPRQETASCHALPHLSATCGDEVQTSCALTPSNMLYRAAMVRYLGMPSLACAAASGTALCICVHLTARCCLVPMPLTLYHAVPSEWCDATRIDAPVSYTKRVSTRLTRGC